MGKPGVKKTFRFKISFSNPGCPLCFPVQNPDPPASHPSLPLEGFGGGGVKHILGSFNAASRCVPSLGWSRTSSRGLAEW